MFIANDVKMPIRTTGRHQEEVHVWFVKGFDDTCYPTKLTAEAAAMQLYRGKDSNSMIYYRTAFIERY